LIVYGTTKNRLFLIIVVPNGRVPIKSYTHN
jgi:hypothetical protein